MCVCFKVQKLQGILKPMMLRRLKEDVEKNLAPKEETIIEVEWFFFFFFKACVFSCSLVFNNFTY